MSGGDLSDVESDAESDAKSYAKSDNAESYAGSDIDPVR